MKVCMVFWKTHYCSFWHTSGEPFFLAILLFKHWKLHVCAMFKKQKRKRVKFLTHSMYRYSNFCLKHHSLKSFLRKVYRKRHYTHLSRVNLSVCTGIDFNDSRSFWGIIKSSVADPELFPGTGIIVPDPARSERADK